MEKDLELLAEIAAIARRSHGVCMYALAFVTLRSSQLELEELRDAMNGWATAETGPRHYDAYRERWGRIPDGG